MEPFHFTTADNIVIYGIKNQPAEIERGILCLHMRPATKESYSTFLQETEKRNWLAAAIDFRGHGESNQGGTLDHRHFEDSDHQRYRIDAYEALMALNDEVEVDTIIGASIGANIALELQADFEIAKTVLLSPGLNYFGVETLPAAEEIGSHQSCYIIASQEKNGVVAQEAQKIYNALSIDNKQIDLYPGIAHGTDIVMDKPERLKKIMRFLAEEEI